jgi:hypothetical protein
MIRYIYLKYAVDPLRNEEVTVKSSIFFRKILSLKGDKSKNIGARVMNLVTYNMVDNKNIYLKFEVDTLRNDKVIMVKNILLRQNFNLKSGRGRRRNRRRRGE